MSRLARRHFLRAAMGAGVAVLAAPRRAWASLASTSQRAAILARALSYEQTLEGRSGKVVDILLVHDASPGTKAEALEWAAAYRSLSNVRIDGKALRVTVAALGDDLPSIFDRGTVDVTVACGDVSNVLIATLSALTRATKTLSVATRRNQVEAGLTLGIVEAAGKVRILVNLKAAKAEGVRFSAKLLKLAEILR